MKYKNLLGLAIFTLSLLLIGLLASKMGNRIAPSSISRVEDLLKQNGFQGSVLIAKEGKMLFKKGYGHANEEHQIPNTSHTVFRIGSITKQITAIAILQLEEQGKLKVSDPIINYLPDYPEGNRITIHHLLSHTAGIPSITDFANLQEIQRHPSTPDRAMGYFKFLPLKFTPGANCEYSDSGYIVLGAIIEKVTNQPYEEVIRTQILGPLQMDATYYDHHRTLIPHRATGYVRNEKGELLHADYLDMSFPHAAGALATTVEDLYKLDRALKEGRILTKGNRDRIFAIQGNSLQNQITYGYGFFIGPRNVELEQADEPIVGHYGTIEGFRAASYRYLDDDLTIILLSNIENTNINALHLAIAAILRSSWRWCAVS